MTKKNIVVVESPAKAKTINKYLGSDYVVIASFGHVRDLPPKDGSVRPEENFAMDWQVDERGKKQLANIAKELRNAQRLILATDPDREGEAISWHIQAALEEKKLLKNIEVQRVTFNEITKSAILTAMAAPRQLDQPLIDAYLARRALDRLVGFKLSPILWRKLPGSRSAGRVQSVALRLICEQEAKIEIFQPQEFWTVPALLTTPKNETFEALLSDLNGKKLEKFSLKQEEDALNAQKILENSTLFIQKIERKQVKDHPKPPFTTSTLQQEASRKLGMSAQTTMRLAQQLYEGVEINGENIGLITYMRTDGVTLSQEAIHTIRGHIHQEFGAQYHPEKPRHYTVKAKNAQEAHEAIRPTNIAYTAQKIARFLNPEQARLYDLIWKRTVASQMSSAELDRTTIIISDHTHKLCLKAHGSIVTFEGYRRLYREDNDDLSLNNDDNLLPPMSEGDAIGIKKTDILQHFTQPPPRFSEASLVKEMEKNGIGRPSTYASTLGVLRDRNYVRLENKRFIPEDRGRLVTSFLTAFFERYVDINFTASLEEQLDDISGARADWHDVMSQFWNDFSQALEQTKDLTITEVIDTLDQELGAHFFPPSHDNSDSRKCPNCQTGRLGLKLSRHGAFLGCSNYPECKSTRSLAIAEQDSSELQDGPKILGYDPVTHDEISLRRGPYGLYLQKGEADTEDKKSKPKRATLPKNIDAETLSIEQALAFLALPRRLGVHPETQQNIDANIGPYGPYVKMGSIYGTLNKDANILTLSFEEAIEALNRKLSTMKPLGDHPKDGEKIFIKKGRFGHYVQHGKIVAPLAKDASLDTLTLTEALTLLNEKGKPLKSAKATKTTKRKTTAKTNAKNDVSATDTEKIAPKPSKAKTTRTKAAPKKEGTQKTSSPKKVSKKAKNIEVNKV